jgi:16S rRNA processing protein RimM
VPVNSGVVRVEAAVAPPQKLITMARVVGPWGVKGWIKLVPHTAEIDMLCAHPGWWLGRNNDWREFRILASEQKGRHLVAQIDGIVVPEEAVKLKGMDVALPRSALPDSGENEFYKADLVGLDVVNEEGSALGSVAELYTNGAHDVLRVVEVGAGGKERLIPFVPAVVRRVDMAGRAIYVDWGADW